MRFSKAVTFLGLFVFLSACSEVSANQETLNTERVQAVVVRKRTHFGGTDDDHFIMYLRVNDSVYKYHNVGKVIYNKYNIGDQFSVLLLTKKVPVLGITYREIKIHGIN